MNGRWQRLPLRLRLVAGFVAVMAVVLSAAGAFVFWRVRLALDTGLEADLAAVRASVLRAAGDGRVSPASIVAAQPPGTLVQVLDGERRVLASTPAVRAPRLDGAGGNLLVSGDRRLRRVTVDLPGTAPRSAVAAVRLGQRDEALRELLAQLTLANGLALAAAATVGYALAGSALRPVERYRARAAEIAGGASGLRLQVASGVDDEISRLGHTLNDMLAAQELAADRQRRLLADASHELRAPLSVLSAEVELALRRPRTADEHEATLQQVAVDTARLVALTEQLLELEAAQVPRPVDAIALEPLVGQVVAGGRRRLSDAGRTLACELEAGLTVALSADAAHQLVRNLVDNAVLHGSGQVTVTGRRLGAATVLSVQDEGDGPPPEFVPRAVERFSRADPARTGPGTGLGLALVHAVAVSAGGELRLCAAGRHHRFAPVLVGAGDCRHDGRGTVVAVWLPSPPWGGAGHGRVCP